MNECHPCIRSILLPIYPLDTQCSMRSVRTILNALEALFVDTTASPSRSALPLPLAGEGWGGGSFFAMIRGPFGKMCIR